MRRRATVPALAALAAALVALGTAPAAAASSPRVLRVGSYRGIPGTFASIQAAVDAARPGDWVLVGPGDYKERGRRGAPEDAGVFVDVPRLHLRGMDRNSVVVDGTRPGSPTCSARKADQIVSQDGRNGILVYKADGVAVENLTACNWLTSLDDEEGNQIYWTGGDGSGKIGLGSYSGAYLTATSSYANGTVEPHGEYGIYASNTRGFGLIDRTFASNMADGAYYIGACRDCNTVIRRAHGESSALGYSGTNSGGRLVITDSEFDKNKTGITTNSQNTADPPSPQIGLCVGDAKGPLGNGICNVWRRNYIHDNNNPNVPGVGSGLAGSAPVGTGFVFAGTTYVALVDNRIENNGAWGVVVTDLPDQGQPAAANQPPCRGGVSVPATPAGDPICYFTATGNQVLRNAFRNNGFFGNPTNGDLALFSKGSNPGNCFVGNTDPAGVSSEPPALQENPVFNTCGMPNASPDPVLAAQLNCATQLLAPCPSNPAASYPQTTKVALRMPPPQPSMPDPCAGVPVNPWCPANGAGGDGANGAGGDGVTTAGGPVGGHAGGSAQGRGTLALTGADARWPLVGLLAVLSAAGLRRLRRRGGD